MGSRLVFLSHLEKTYLEAGRKLVRAFFWMIHFSWALPAAAQSDTAEPQAQQELVEGFVDADEEPVDTAEGELTEEQIEALIQSRREKRRKERMNRRVFLPDKNYNQEFLAIIGLLLLWLYTRKHNREVEARRPIRANPLSPDELGRVLFGLLQSKNALGYRALFLNGVEARTMMGQEDAESYLEERSGVFLQGAFQAMVAKMPIGAIYKECSISEEVCTLVIADTSGKEFALSVGRVALVGAVIRLVSPGNS